MKRLPAFTLIEVILYSAIVSVLIALFTMTAWQMSTTHQADLERQRLAENVNFALLRYQQLLLGWPSVAVTPTSVETSGIGANHFRLAIAGGVLDLTRDTNSNGVIDANDTVYPLTNSNIVVTGSFTGQTIGGEPTVRFQATLKDSLMGTSATIDKTVYLP